MCLTPNAHLIADGNPYGCIATNLPDWRNTIPYSIFDTILFSFSRWHVIRLRPIFFRDFAFFLSVCVRACTCACVCVLTGPADKTRRRSFNSNPELQRAHQFFPTNKSLFWWLLFKKMHHLAQSNGIFVSIPSRPTNRMLSSRIALFFHW